MRATCDCRTFRLGLFKLKDVANVKYTVGFRDFTWGKKKIKQFIDNDYIDCVESILNIELLEQY